MVQLTPDELFERQVLSASLKAIRKRRGLGTDAVALAMGLPSRTYQYFEAGRGGLRLELLRRFALATRSDPWAIMLGVGMRDPHFAVRAMNYKVGSVILILLKGLNTQAGDLLGQLDVATLLSRLRPAFDLLVQDALTGDPGQGWLDDNVQALAGRPAGGGEGDEGDQQD